MAIAFVLAFGFASEAQIDIKKLGNQMKRSAEQQVEQKVKEKTARETREALDRGEKKLDQGVSNASSGGASSGNKAVSQGDEIPQGTKTLYVSVSNGSNRNEGSQASPLKDLQKAIDEAPEGAVICVAEGNYLGYLDQGWVKVNKYVSIVGGYSNDFSQRDPIKFRTTMRPGAEQIMTSGNQGVMDIRVVGKRNGVVLVDGIIFDRGQINLYIAPIHDDDRAAAPEGCETGRIVNVDETPPLPVVEPAGMKSAFQLISGEMEGNLTIRNCVFLNGYHFGIQMACRGGHFDVYNNVFVANRMAACEVRGSLAQPNTSSLAFHDNTILFTWCRTKHMEDMGYGFRYMTGIDADVYNNIVGCSNYGGLDRAYVDADKAKEAKRVTSAWNNLFFGNRNGDMVLPSGGGGWTFVLAKNFEDVNQLTQYENNREMNEAEVNAISSKIDAPYLKGFIGITGTQTSEFNPNSSVNQFRNALGMNMQGTETVRVSMYGNRYPFEKVFDLFGAIEGYGAQTIN